MKAWIGPVVFVVGMALCLGAFLWLIAYDTATRGGSW